MATIVCQPPSSTVMGGDINQGMNNIKVAVRIAPQGICSGTCIEVIPETQQILAKRKGTIYKFDFVFENTPQIDVYESAVKQHVKHLFEGYNVSVIAYGESGSGKTYTMGTLPSSNESDVGVIPRAIADIFDPVTKEEDWNFKVEVSFFEIYNYSVLDLLNKKTPVVMREDNGNFFLPTLTHEMCNSAEDVMRCLHQGSSCRTTAATAINEQSSRSHAIFTIYIHQTRGSDEHITKSSKFNLVDLAGSEKLNKTLAEKERLKEGSCINMELMELGRVIKALFDKQPYVSFRGKNTKLPSLMKDSLGGNSFTTFIACVSPDDGESHETYSTLEFSHRVSNIENNPIVRVKQQKREEPGGESSKKQEVSRDPPPPALQELAGQELLVPGQREAGHCLVRPAFQKPCRCRGDCTIMRCGCFKAGLACNNCSCFQDRCKNKTAVQLPAADETQRLRRSPRLEAREEALREEEELQLALSQSEAEH